MKKLIRALALFKGLRGAKKQVNNDTTFGEDINDFIDMIKATVGGSHKVKKRNIGFAILGVLYVLNPLDLLPALALGPIGLVDDAAVLVFIYKRLTAELERFRSSSKFQDAEVVS